MLGDFSPVQMASACRVLALCREMASALRQGQGLQADMNEIRDWISARPARTLSRSIPRRENRVLKRLDSVELNFDEVDRKLSSEKDFLKQEGVDPDSVVAAAFVEELGQHTPELRARIEEVVAQKREVIKDMDKIEVDFDRGATREKYVGLRKKYLKLQKQWDRLDREFWQHAVGDLQLRDEQINA